MELLARERDRLLHRTARLYGLGFSLLAFVCLTIPGAVEPVTYAVCVPLFAVLAFAQFRLGSSQSLPWVVLTAITGIALILVIAAGEPSGAGISAITQLAAGSIPAIGIVSTNSLPRRTVALVGFAIVAALTTTALSPVRGALPTFALVLLGWALAGVVGFWVSAAVPHVAHRIASIGRAHRAERQASELEAQRRQGARLLHDTVLATLTLLAHSGVGVHPDALRQQAADDARLLRQLRLGGSPTPQSSGGYHLEPVEETELGTTLESVKQRFGRMGLEVNWHGRGQVLLPSDVLDAFLLALAECLENVRRHSGVDEAHVTITEDESTLRAIVTDAGVGFELTDVDSARLGLKESIVGRVQEVGGTVHLFSSPGAGTTVILEVPR